MYNKVMYKLGQFIGSVLIVCLFIWILIMLASPVIVLVWLLHTL